MAVACRPVALILPALVGRPAFLVLSLSGLSLCFPAGAAQLVSSQGLWSSLSLLLSLVTCTSAHPPSSVAVVSEILNLPAFWGERVCLSECVCVEYVLFPYLVALFNSSLLLSPRSTCGSRPLPPPPLPLLFLAFLWFLGRAEREYIRDHFLSRQTLVMVEEMRRQFRGLLRDIGFIEGVESGVEVYTCSRRFARSRRGNDSYSS